MSAEIEIGGESEEACGCAEVLSVVLVGPGMMVAAVSMLVLVGDVCVGDDFPDVAVFAVEVEATTLVLVVDLAVRP